MFAGINMTFESVMKRDVDIRKGLYASVDPSEGTTKFAGINMTFESVMRRDVNIRKGLYANVDISKGTTMFAGINMTFESVMKRDMNMGNTCTRAVTVRREPPFLVAPT